MEKWFSAGPWQGAAPAPTVVVTPSMASRPQAQPRVAAPRASGWSNTTTANVGFSLIHILRRRFDKARADVVHPRLQSKFKAILWRINGCVLCDLYVVQTLDSALRSRPKAIYSGSVRSFCMHLMTAVHPNKQPSASQRFQRQEGLSLACRLCPRGVKVSNHSRSQGPQLVALQPKPEPAAMPPSPMQGHPQDLPGPRLACKVGQDLLHSSSQHILPLLWPLTQVDYRITQVKK